MKRLLTHLSSSGTSVIRRFRQQPPLVRTLQVALVLSLLGALMAWPTLLQAWLTAWVLLAFLPLGAMALLMVHGLTGGAWGDESHFVWRNLAASMPLFALALLPLLLGLDVLFPWMAPHDTLPDVVRQKRFYLNEPFFIARTLLYLMIWVGLSLGLARPPSSRSSAPHWYAPGLIVWALTVTFFCYDWLMSLEPTFYSDIYGLEIMAICVVSVLALGLFISVVSLRPSIRLDLANLWLAVLLGWAFLAFSQLIIVWSANLPFEIGWYLNRSEGAWLWVGRLSTLLFLAIPFAMLLPTAAKRRSGWLRLTAAIALVGYLLHMHWLVWPSFTTSGWAFLFGPIAIVTLATAALWWIGDTRRHALIAFRSVEEKYHDGT